MRLAVVTGLREEAACIAAPPPGVVIACAGPGPDAAVEAARRLLDAGAPVLVSFGVAGALSPQARPGRLLLPREVVLPDGTRYSVSAPLRGRLASLLPDALAEPLTGSDTPVLTVAAKQVLHRATAAVAVDMESHALARLAAERGVPFLALRAVADAADAAVPPLAMAGVAPNGRTRAWPVARGLVRRPWQLPALLRLAWHMRRATTALRRAAPALRALVAATEEEKS